MSSLLWRTKRLIALRKKHHAFGRGSIEILHPENPRVFTFVRELDGESILVVVNLSRFASRRVELDLSRSTRRIIPTGGAVRAHDASRTSRRLPYTITLGGYAFYWLALEAPEDPERLRASYLPPAIDGSSFGALAGGFERGFLEDVLPAFVRSRRWFRGRGRVILAGARDRIDLDRRRRRGDASSRCVAARRCRGRRPRRTPCRWRSSPRERGRWRRTR